VRHGQAEARRTVRNLRELDSEGGDLPRALERIMQELAQGGGLQTELQIQGTPAPLPDTMENHLLRIGQEAVTNALKHGDTKNIRMELIYAASFVELMTTDDGRGFDPEGTTATEAGHFGLLGMRERTNKIGGTLSIVSKPGRGTTVTVKVPLPHCSPLTKTP
jgi:signal transduction histidine kinase